MIEYGKGLFGFSLLFRIHGSAMIKACLPSLLSLAFYYVFLYVYSPKHVGELAHLGHPYAVGVLMTGVSFLIVFRANYGYQRYWEACGAAHQMMSKILDATVHMAAFHMQCSHYDSIKPPSFFDHPEFMKQKLSVDRQRLKLAPASDQESLSYEKSINLVNIDNVPKERRTQLNDSRTNESVVVKPKTILGKGRLDGGWGLLQQSNSFTTETSETVLPPQCPTSWALGVTPSLFLQELAHLSSLTIAVAFCTLRNDVEGAVSPLGIYIPGSPFPEADPDKMDAAVRSQFLTKYTILKHIRYFLGIDRTAHGRTQYNAARPMLVLGGVSDNEIIRLQRAKGPLAKTQLCWYWLSEFCTREHIAGSTGKVGAPIISRVHQFLSDGMIFYNHARKIMFIPFPFPHAQISALSIFVMIIYVPFLMDQYTEETWVGASLTFFTVLCLAGLHEVARELENPFRNVPNDIPLCTLLAMYNEALVTMCTGYHPDHFWTPPKSVTSEPSVSITRGETNSSSLRQRKPQSELAPKATPAPPQISKEYETKIDELEKLLMTQAKQIEELRAMVQPNHINKVQ